MPKTIRLTHAGLAPSPQLLALRVVVFFELEQIEAQHLVLVCELLNARVGFGQRGFE